MKILITGANGFVGKNLVLELGNRGYSDLLLCDIDTTPEQLDAFTEECAFVFHLAGVNRPEHEEDFMNGNYGFTDTLLGLLRKHENKAPILITSSIQAALGNPYGKSKLAGEELLLAYGRENDVKTFVFRLPNVFGKFARPNYNSAVATFCHNISHDLPITVSDPTRQLELVYIDDVVGTFISVIEGKMLPRDDGRCYVDRVHRITLEMLTELLYSFRAMRKDEAMPCDENRKKIDTDCWLRVPNLNDDFVKSLYSTYLSYLPEDGFAYRLKMNSDNRGSFTEFLKTDDRGQLSVNITNPGITKGNHWHHTKNEKYLVVSGEALIKLRKVINHEATGEPSPIIEYRVDGKKLFVVDIPPGYTHSITNIGKEQLVTIMWANELFKPENPDTYPMDV